MQAPIVAVWATRSDIMQDRIARSMSRLGNSVPNTEILDILYVEQII